MENQKRRVPSFVFLLFVGVLTILFFVLPKEAYSSAETRAGKSTGILLVILDGWFSGQQH